MFNSEKHRDDIAINVLFGLNILNQSKETYVAKNITIERAIRHAIAIIRNPDLFFAIQEEEGKAWLERTVKEEQEGKQEKNALDIIKEKLIEIIDIIKTKEN
jgi:hypothetical protein